MRAPLSKRSKKKSSPRGIAVKQKKKREPHIQRPNVPPAASPYIQVPTVIFPLHPGPALNATPERYKTLSLLLSLLQLEARGLQSLGDKVNGFRRPPSILEPELVPEFRTH